MSAPAVLSAPTNDWAWVIELARLNADVDREAATIYLARGETALARHHMDLSLAAEERARSYEARLSSPSTISTQGA